MLGLRPHPEGGFFHEIYRSDARVGPGDGRAHRSAATTIFFLLTEGTHSRWHRVLSDEIWHLYEGGPIELWSAPPTCETVQRTVLGAAVQTAGPVHVIRAGWWQAARPLAPYALAGCTVAPGFEFDDFRLIEDEPAALEKLARLDPEAAKLS